MTIKIEGTHFKDESGRILILRGINLGGSSKVPSRPDGASHLLEGYFDHRQVSFVGRPFPLEEADHHFRRLKAWGFPFLRLVVTWEAIEHAGPGQYDHEYLAYLRALVEKAGDYGFSLFIDFHQDMWSRFSGGDGAPGWTLEAAGFDIAQFGETGAAIVHQLHGDPLPKTIWSTNQSKLAAATMFTLFFGGRDFAPQVQVDGESIQEYLQRHYLNAVLQVVDCLKDLPNVVGYDAINEPLSGFIGLADLDQLSGELSLGDSPTAFQAILLGSGLPQDVQIWKIGLLGLVRAGTRRLNEGGAQAWQKERECIWKQHGVWGLDSDGAPSLLQPDYFAHFNSFKVDFNRDYYVPFLRRFTSAVLAAHPQAVIFIEPSVSGKTLRWNGEAAGHIAYAPHWYDGYVLAKLSFSRFLGVDFDTHKILFGPLAVRKSFTEQLGRLKKAANRELGGIPTLIGEFGIPFDLDSGRSFRTGSFQNQVQALDRSFQALETNLLSSTLWNYTADNSNARGDLWNSEDFSLFSRDQQLDPSDINSGGRALPAAVRPYPAATAGTPLKLAFDLGRRTFEYRFRHDPKTTAPTELFVPNLQYPDGYEVEVSDGNFEKYLPEQRLVYHHGTEQEEHILRIRPLKTSARPLAAP